MNKVELQDLVGGAWKNAAMKNIKSYLEEDRHTREEFVRRYGKNYL